MRYPVGEITTASCVAGRSTEWEMHAACGGVGKRIGVDVTAGPVRACLIWCKADLNLCSISPRLCGRSCVDPGL